MMGEGIRRTIDNMYMINRDTRLQLENVFNKDRLIEGYYYTVTETLKDPLNEEIVLEFWKRQQGTLSDSDYENYIRQWGFRPNKRNLVQYFNNLFDFNDNKIRSRIDSMTNLAIFDIGYISDLNEVFSDRVLYHLSEFTCNYTELFIIPKKIRFNKD